jgi:hypothetical protein
MSSQRAVGHRWRQRLEQRIRRAGTAVALAAVIPLQGCDDGQGPDDVVHVVEVTPAQAVLLTGDTAELTGRAKGPDGTVRQGLALDWSTPNPDLVTVAGSGATVKIVALRAGLAEVSAGARGKVGLATVEVRNRAPVLAALEPAAAIAGGEGFTLVVTGVGFAADAAILWNGQARTTQHVSGQELRATITAADIAQPGAVEVAVLNPEPGGGTAALGFTIAGGGPVAVDVQPGIANLAVGQTAALAATPRDLLGNDLEVPVTWSSGTPNVASVSATGVVTGVAPGVAAIGATAGNVTGYAVVTVTTAAGTPPTIAGITPDSVESSPEGLEVVIRGTGFLPTSGAFLNASSRPTEYVSASELRMTLWPGDLAASATRQVHVYNPGPTGGTSAGATLTIVPGVWSVRIAPDTAIGLWAGQEQQLQATAYDEQNRPLAGRPATWQSSDPSVATVDVAGRVRAVAPGHVVIEAVIAGRKGSRSIEVYAPLPWDLLYEGNHGGPSELWLLTLGPDAAPRRILAAGTWATDPAASPDGSRIAFVGMSVDGARNIFVVNRDGSGLRQLTADVAVDDQPAWSRDGTRIAFRSQREGVSDIFVVNADGSGLANVTRNTTRGTDGPKSAERPTWTPAGRIVFTYGPALLSPLAYRLVSVAPDGSDWQELTDGTWRDYEPEVSPNGKLIALRRASEQLGSFIDIIAANGSQLAWIGLPSPGFTPSWSPDGTLLTFSQSTGPGQSRILLSGFNGAGERVIVPGGGRNPVWIRRP